jgi:thymidine kinase
MSWLKPKHLFRWISNTFALSPPTVSEEETRYSNPTFEPLRVRVRDEEGKWCDAVDSSNVTIVHFRPSEDRFVVPISEKIDYNHLDETCGAGYLSITMGSMFAGKTTDLIQNYHRFMYQNRIIFVLNYAEDSQRYGSGGLYTHDQLSIPCVFSKTLGEIWRNPHHPNFVQLCESEIVLINEAQFFPDIYECVLELVENHRKRVYLYGLDGDFLRRPFILYPFSKGWLDLIPYADVVLKKKADCEMCGGKSKAIFSHRFTNEIEQVVIGSDNYMPLCRECYRKCAPIGIPGNRF